MIKHELKVFESGNKENKPVIFIHGFPFDHLIWENQVEIFKNDFYCITYDIRGMGDSPAGDGQFTLESFVDDLEFIMDSQKIIKPVLCGISMGGYIAFRAVERMQDKLGGLILCDTKPEPDTNEGKLKRAQGIKSINQEGVQNFISGFVPNCFAENFRYDNEKEYGEILSRSLNSDPLGVKGCLLAMQGRTDVSSYLHEIKIPVLLVCGELDKFTPPDIMKVISDKIPNSEFAIIPGAGHMTPFENPEMFNEIAGNFLRKNFI